MKDKIKHVLDITTYSTSLIALIAIVFRPDEVYTFMDSLNNVSWFGVLICFLFIALFLTNVKKKTIPNLVGPASTDEKRRVKKLRAYNIRLNFSRVLAWLLVIALFFWLGKMNYSTAPFGILQEKPFDKSDYFRADVNSKVNGERPSRFASSESDKINYGVINDSGVSKPFSRKFEQGLLYATQYDRAQNFMNVRIRWFGKNYSSDPVYAEREFSNFELSVDTDYNVMANFILSFLYMHTGAADSAKACGYFDSVLKSISAITNLSRRREFEKLASWINRYYLEPRALHYNTGLPNFPELSDSLSKKYIGYLTLDGSVYINGFDRAFRGALYVIDSGDVRIALNYDTSGKVYDVYRSDKKIEHYQNEDKTAIGKKSGTVIMMAPEWTENPVTDTIAEQALQDFLAKYNNSARYKINNEFLINRH